MNSEKVGILLTAGYIKSQETSEKPYDHPNACGIERISAASFAIKRGFVDKVVVVGGMPDSKQIPVEVGHEKKLLWYVGDNLAEKVTVLPREKLTAETMGDLRQATHTLKNIGLDNKLTIISDRAHLYPRTVLAMWLLGYRRAKYLSVESLLGQLSYEIELKTGITIPVVTGYGGLKITLARELPLSLILATDLLPGGELGSQFLEKKAIKDRVRVTS